MGLQMKVGAFAPRQSLVVGSPPCSWGEDTPRLLPYVRPSWLSPTSARCSIQGLSLLALCCCLLEISAHRGSQDPSPMCANAKASLYYLREGLWTSFWCCSDQVLTSEAPPQALRPAYAFNEATGWYDRAAALFDSATGVVQLVADETAQVEGEAAAFARKRCGPGGGGQGSRAELRSRKR